VPKRVAYLLVAEIPNLTLAFHVVRGGYGEQKKQSLFGIDIGA
jgi:hypothetical protein